MQPARKTIFYRIRCAGISLVLGVFIAGVGTPAIAPIQVALSKPVQMQVIPAPKPVFAMEKSKPVANQAEKNSQLTWQNHKASMTHYTLIAGILGLLGGLGFVIASLWKRASNEWSNS